MKEPLLNLLGLARRAGKLAMGHDMAMESLKNGKSALVLISRTASTRLEKEFRRAAENLPVSAGVRIIPYSIDELHHAVGYKAGVFSVNDAGFAAKMLQLLAETRPEQQIQNSEPKGDNNI